MAMNELKGVDSLLAKLDAVTKEIKFKGGRFGLRKAANLVADAVKAGAASVDDPVTANSIARNVAVKFSPRTFKRTGNLLFRVGILGGAQNYANTKDNVRAGRAGKSFVTGGDKSNPGGDTWYWRLLEFGTQNMAARPFMRPALGNNADAAIGTFAREAEKSIDRALKRAKK